MSLLPGAPASTSLVVDLARIVGAGAVSTTDGDRFAYARDCWPRDLIRLRAGELGAAPSCVVWPESQDEVARVLDLCAERQIPVVPFGAGSGVAGGARPSEGGVTLDLKRMRALRRIDEDDLRLEVEAGIIGERLERTLNSRGYTLGHFPSSILCSTLGGWLAARSAGQASTLYGKIEDMTLGLEVVTPGRIRRAMLGPRPSRGPDMNALVIGSEGTFGVITAAELRLRPLPEARRMQGFRFHGAESGIEAIRRILRAGLRPAVVRLYDALDTFMGRGHGDPAEEPSEARSIEILSQRARGLYDDLTKAVPARLSPPRASQLAQRLVRGTVRAVLGAPMLLNRAIEVLPEDCLLILGFEGQPALVAAEHKAAAAIVEPLGAVDLGPGPGEHWLRNRYAVSFKQSKAYASGAFTDTMEVAATWERLLPLYRGVKKVISRDAFVMAHFSHAYPEGCSIYFTFAGAAPEGGNTEAILARYDRIWKNAIAAVHDAGGTLSHHHGVGELKAQGMAAEHGPGGMRLLGALKDAFDPRGILNPGKLGFEPRAATRVRPRPRPGRIERGLPREIRAAVGESNLSFSGSRVAVRPPDESALASVLRVAHGGSIPIYSDQTGHRAPPGAVSIELDRLSGVTRLSGQSLFVEAEAGIAISELEALLGSHGLTLGALHPRAETRSLGAALARGLLIRRGVALGDLRDLCFAVRGLLANGTPIETRPVPRSATGPELDRALISGEGRWGMITRATLRVAVAPPLLEPIAYELPSLRAAIEAARLVLRRGVKPIAGRVLASGVLAMDLVAHTDDMMQAQVAIVASTLSRLEGRLVREPDLARAGRFDAVVEIASLWSHAEAKLEAARAAANGEVWLDFFAPEGTTIVARVVDPASRRAVGEAAARLGWRILSGLRASDVTEDAERIGIAVPPGSPASREKAEDLAELGPYEDIADQVSAILDPAGVFRPRRSGVE
ncbi:MAG: FAD-binding oxidoreductase [Deltaproteobacteria bacterium]|nr:FAD-binding oxidoreductase [Deltaproteobacteria bacterium]